MKYKTSKIRQGGDKERFIKFILGRVAIKNFNCSLLMWSIGALILAEDLAIEHLICCVEKKNTYFVVFS